MYTLNFFENKIKQFKTFILIQKEIEKHIEIQNKETELDDQIFVSEAQRFYDTNFQHVIGTRQKFDDVKEKVWKNNIIFLLKSLF